MVGDVGCEAISVGPKGAIDAKRSTSRTGRTKPSTFSIVGIDAAAAAAAAKGCRFCLEVEGEPFRPSDDLRPCRRCCDRKLGVSLVARPLCGVSSAVSGVWWEGAVDGPATLRGASAE